MRTLNFTSFAFSRVSSSFFFFSCLTSAFHLCLCACYSHVNWDIQMYYVVKRKMNKLELELALLRQGGLRAGVPTRYNEFKQLSVFYRHTKAFYRCSGVFDNRCSMPPISWEEMKMDFISDRISRIFHLVFDQTKLFYTL